MLASVGAENFSDIGLEKQTKGAIEAATQDVKKLLSDTGARGVLVEAVYVR
jgi:hypothetical protein